MIQRTPLYQSHVAMGAKMVDFHGWEMPIHYGSQIEEHHQVRTDVGMFDVSHMNVVDLTGERVREFLRFLLANNVDRLQKTGKALYTCMLLETGGVIDDLIVYYMNEQWFRLVLNSATRDNDMDWIARQATGFDITITSRPELAMIAVQGPNARASVHTLLGEQANLAATMAPFNAVTLGDLFVARTGYTGEDGYEIILPASQVEKYWHDLHQLGVKPIGLGARDTLRLEAGMNLYGADMTEQTSPLESGLGWTVAWEPESRNFIGRQALEAQRQQPAQYKLIGLVLTEKGMLRDHQKVIVDGGGEGEITSGSFSPTLNRAIALARVPASAQGTCRVEIRGKLYSASIVSPPFVRHGKPCVSEVVTGITI